MSETLALTDISTLVTMDIPGFEGPIPPSKIQDIALLQDAFVEIKAGKIVSYGEMKDFQGAEHTVNCQGKTVLPGLVDPHTHLVFAGHREHELVERIERGRNISKGQRMSGGINFTMTKTREASFDELLQETLKRMSRLLAYGTTTAEAKSGYGLSLEHELKSLEVLKKANTQHPIDLVMTFLGAHAVPQGLNQSAYLEEVLAMIPVVAQKGLAEFCDIFCEEGFFTPEDSYRVLQSAKDHGLKLKVHADELANSGGSLVAAELGAISADHLQFAPREHLEKMQAAGTLPVLLPGTAFYLGLPYANTSLMRELDMPMVISTDLNPGGCYCESQGFMVVLACTQMQMLPLEAWVGVTLNAAYAIDRGKIIGSLRPGKAADLVVFDAPNADYIPYHFGVNLVEQVFKSGKLVHSTI